jgi:ubiquinone/menaquinone biosynthesis C-methylase UbiE
VIRIEIPGRHYLLYLLLPHPVKMALLSPAAHRRLDRINAGFNEALYSGEGARAYDRIHRYAEAEQHDYPAALLVDRVWAPAGYGRALEIGAGSGYFTTRVARRAERVLALEPVPDMQAELRARCAREGLANVQVLGGTAADLPRLVPPASVDSALLLQSLHHLHRRAEVFAALGRVVRPGGRLYLVEPHHNLRRAARLLRKYVAGYRAPAFRGDERNWATHDFLTRRELRQLCRRGGFEDVRLSAHWFPYTRRLVPDPARRYRVERALGRVPVARHWAAVLAMEARRGGAP